MTLQELTSRLTLRAVIAHYGLRPDQNDRLICPWHDDKTPSLQLYFKTNSWTCFSSKCQAGSGDALEFCCKTEGDKGKGIKVAKEIVEGFSFELQKPNKPASSISETNRLVILLKAWEDARIAYQRSEKAQAYAENRAIEGAELGFMARTIGPKWTEGQQALGQAVGLLTKSNRPKMADCLVFALKNCSGQIVGLYGRKIDGNGHYYLSGPIQGFYPVCPPKTTKRLLLTESVIDAASLPEQVPGTAVMALYGAKGMKPSHHQVIGELSELEEIVFMFDGDEAGWDAVGKYVKELPKLRPEVRISAVHLPSGEDVNGMAQGHDISVFDALIGDRTEMYPDIFRGKVEKNGAESREKGEATKEQPTQSPAEGAISVSIEREKRDEASPTTDPRLQTSDPEKLTFSTETLEITIWGGIDSQVLSRLKVNLQLKRKGAFRSFREDVNLYSHRQTKALVGDASEALEVPMTSLQAALDLLTTALENYRLQLREDDGPKEVKVELTEAEKEAARALLRSPELVKQTIQSIAGSGLIGERKNGLLLFFIYLTRMNEEPLHAIIHGKSGSGKTYLQSRISDLLPQEELVSVTSLSENTLYYSPKGYFSHKVLLIEDLDGTYAALYPLREFMTKGSLSKLTTDKDKQGNNAQRKLHVEGPVCVSGATTSAEIYEDNANRSYAIEVDESRKHAEAVMDYQREEKAGEVDKSAQEAARKLLQNAQRMLQPVRVINRYAMWLKIPVAVFKPLRTNMHYLRLIESITLYHQYQRTWKKDKAGESYIETSLEDIAWANWLVKESLLRKSDELNGRERQFFERLKAMLEEGTGSFFAKDIRKKMRLHPMVVKRHLSQLEKIGLIQQVGYNRKTGYEYEVTCWDDYEQLKEGVEILDRILEELRAKENGEKGDENGENS